MSSLQALSVMSGQSRLGRGQVRSDQVKIRSKLFGSVCVKTESGQFRSGQVRLGQVRSGQVRSGRGQIRSDDVELRSGLVRSGCLRPGSGQVESGPILSWQAHVRSLHALSVISGQSRPGQYFRSSRVRSG